MFQPNSIRSLLSKRKSNRLSSASSSKQQQQKTVDSTLNQTSMDPDYETVMQIKLIKKQIQNKIDNIRQWRQHQKQLMQQKMKSNLKLNEQIKKQYIKNIQKQSQKQEKQLKKILKKLGQPTQIKIEQNQQQYDSERIFKVLTQTDSLIETLKHKNLQFKPQEDSYSNLVSQMDSINHIFKKDVNNTEQKQNSLPNRKQQASRQVNKKVDQQLLKKEMDQIDNQLKQIQQLLADDNDKYLKKQKQIKK